MESFGLPFPEPQPSVLFKMDPRFSSYEFSKHFNNLSYLGVWPVEKKLNPLVKKIHFVCRLFFIGILAMSVSLELADLFLNFGNFRKVTFNLSTSVIVVGYPIKLLLMLSKRKSLMILRLRLWRDSLQLSGPEELAMKNNIYKELKQIRYIFYIAYAVFIPFVSVTSYYSYLWGPRELPFAAYFPISDPMKDSNFLPVLSLEVFCSFYIIIMVTECELAIYSLILQMNLYYEVLIFNMQKINDIYRDENDEENKFGWKEIECYKEVNFYLKKKKVTDFLKKCVIRHLELIEYSKMYEYIYNFSMFIQLSFGAFLIIMNCFILSLHLHELNARFGFQVGFLSGIAIDFLFYCFYLSKLSSQCNDVGKAAYSTDWYKMKPEMRRNFNLIITCSKKSPRITAGKIFHIEVPLLLSLARITYSWVMLMRQVMIK